METNQNIKTKGTVLWTLPKEMVILILSFLPLREIGKVSVLSRTMRELSNNDLLWKTLFEQSYIERGLTIPINPPKESWKESYKLLAYFSTFIEAGDKVELNHNIAKMSHQNTTGLALGRFHYSGKHHYVVKIEELEYIGIGVASTTITKELVQMGEKLHDTRGCSVYYYTGTWYGRKEINNENTMFKENDQVHVYFDVESGQVEYYNGSKFVGRCKTLGKDEHKDGLRLGVVLRTYYRKESIVSIVDYQPIDVFPTQKNTKITDLNVQ
eukprot:TRINITY_DN464_c0_g1_i6.p1 TRINITY_DN464_c0_g1~~TRINITY_DN464_c0_g1_i6.p1  ORF type:complete len:269 (+),score=39.13 TRINITY_DN464_c0_g1_i6:70-876(+)